MAKKKDKPKPSSNGRLKDSDVKKFSQAKLTEYLQNKSYRLNDRWLTPDMLSTRRKAEGVKAAKARDAVEVVPNSGLTFGRLKDQEKYSETLAFGRSICRGGPGNQGADQCQRGAGGAWHGIGGPGRGHDV